MRHRQVGHTAGLVYALSNRAASAYNLEHYVESRRYVLEALEVANDMQFLPGIMLCLASLADIANSLHEYPTALVHGTEALALTLQTRDPRQAVWVRAAMGIAELGMDNPVAAHEHFCRGIAAGLAIKAVPRTLEALVALAHWQTYVGELEAAAEVLGFCMHHPNLQRKVRDRATRLRAQLEQRLDAKSLETALARGQSKSIEQVASEVLAEYNTTNKLPLALATSTAW